MAKLHEWSQTESEVVVKFPIDPSVGKDKLRIKIDPGMLCVQVAGNAIFRNELSNKVNVDESFWSIEGTGPDRCLVVSLYKKKDKVQWRGLTKEEEESAAADVLAPEFDVMALEHDDDDPERVEEQEENERKLEARYNKLLEEKGLEDESTLQTFFALFDNCIQLYRLNKLYDYLQKVVPACRKRTDKYKLKAIQALAFVLWKQSKFREALPLFHEMEDILGKGAALCENIAHTYNSLGDYDKAEDYFRQALKFIEQEHGLNRGNRGGVLLGLGLVRDRLGKHREALPVIKQAYEFYKERANGAPASLQAKAGISCAKLHAKLGELGEAEKYIKEAVHMYEVTCGETSPLTASAYHELGKCLWAQRKREDAQKALARAYELEAMKDAWDLVTLLEIHNMLMDTHLKATSNINRAKFAEFFKTSDFIANRVRKTLPQDGNAAVYYKAAGELRAWGGRYQEAKDYFNEAIPLFENEKGTDCSSLIQGCRDMLAFCDRNLAGVQNSPMNFEIPIEKVDDAAPAEGGYAGNSEEHEPTEDLSAEPSVGSSALADAATNKSRELALEYRLVQAGDFSNIAKLLSGKQRRLLFPDEASLALQLEGAGKGLCWAAVLGGILVGAALCGSDGVFAHVLQLAVSGDSVDVAQEPDVCRGLLDRCAEACRERRLRALRAEGAVVGTAGGDLLEGLGWQASHFVYSTPCAAEPSGSTACGAAVASAPAQASSPSSRAAPAAASSLRKEGKDTSKYYEDWHKVDVERTLVQEDGVDPSVVPERVVHKEDFGELGNGLDVSTKITKYSWDQSKANVSLYIPFDGVQSLPESDVQCVFRQRGVLLVIRQGTKRHWYKVPNLCQDIDIDGSSRKIKADQVAIKLRKVSQGSVWSDLTDEKDRYQRQRQYRLEHGDLKGATTEQLLADMYEHANDEERAGLRDAMRVNRQKREEESRSAP